MAKEVKISNQIRISCEDTKKKIIFLMQCMGHNVVSKFIAFIVNDYGDMKYNLKLAQTERDFYKTQYLKLVKKVDKNS